MLSDLFFNLLKINVMATIVALIVLTLKYILKKCGAPRKVLFYLWIVVALRFVCPTFIESNFSLFNVFDVPNITENQVVFLPSNTVGLPNTDLPSDEQVPYINQESLSNVETTNNEVHKSSLQNNQATQSEQSQKLKAPEVIMLIWFAGTSFMILYSIISFAKLEKTVMFAVKGDGEYYETDMISTPCVIGIIKPKIYLTLNLSEKEKNYILTHENTHIKRKDYISKFIAYLILSIHWINPLCWVLFKVFVNDMEMLCDEESIKKLGEDNKNGYMESLLALSSNKKNVLPCPIAFGENNTEKRVKNMIKYKKSGIIISIVALLVCVILAIVCLTNRNVHPIENVSEGSYELFTYHKVLKGKNGTSLFVDIVSDDEYNELLKILYPNGIVDEQGQEIGIVENAEEVRKKFIDEHTKAYTVINGTTKEVELERFYIDLKEMLEELYFTSTGNESEYLFYKATIGDDVFVFPSEWGALPFGFIDASKDNSYYTYTSWGIWKIDTEKLSLDKLTTDEFEGKTYIEIINEIGNDETVDNEGSLYWIDSVQISPNNNYIVYRSNRGSENLSETSIWKLDLKTRAEEKVLMEDLYNDIVDFASDDVIVVGSTQNTRLVNLTNLNVQKIKIPNEPNVSVQGVKNGKLFYTTYEDGSEQTTTVLNELNIETGELTELERFPLRYTNLIENIEYITFDDMLYLQNDVDNGHYSWRLKPEDVVREYWYAMYGISGGEISDAQYIGLDECIVLYTLNNQEYVLNLTRPMKKGDTGIWVIKGCELHEEGEVVNLTHEKESYIRAIKDLYYNHKLPDGNEFEDPKNIENYDMAENRFAICDIDSDGKDELLIALTHFPMAAMRTIIYDYDSYTNKFREQITEFNWMNFYDNGILEAMWSHNQGVAGDALWPYTMYKYDVNSDSYKVVAQVDAWNKLFADTNWLTETFVEFPDEIDVDEDGIVYYITPDGNLDLTKVVDSKEYNEWRNENIPEGTKKIEVSYVNFTEENIANIK